MVNKNNKMGMLCVFLYILKSNYDIFMHVKIYECGSVNDYLGFHVRLLSLYLCTHIYHTDDYMSL